MPLTSGTRVGPYEIVDPLGAGGMGEVYRARDTRLRRDVALKVLPADVADDAGRRARFEQEAHAAAALNHPNILAIHDVGSDGGTFYIATELVNGRTLAALLEEGPIPVRTLLDIAVQIADGLAAAHAVQMVHRDVKPANIFTCRRGQDYDFVKVLDFGLVAASADASDMRTQLTADGVMSGTPAFMAPEMASGEGAIDARTDVYALGCVAYWLLTGRVVFEGNSAVAVILKHARDLPAPPSSRTELPIDPELERIVLACLAKDPDDRPASAAILSQQLEECARTAGAWTNDSAMQWWRMHAPEAGARGPLVSPRHAPAGRLLAPHKRATG
jgi:serine/threonine-protein kinase